MGMSRSLPRPSVLATVALAALLVVACTSGAGASSRPSEATASATSSPSGAPRSEPPKAPNPSASAGPDASTGLDMPTGDIPALPPKRIVTPKPGQLDVHPIAADAFSASVDGRKVVVEIAFTSGVEPCYVLDSIVVERGDHSFAITLRQGHAPGDAVCIEIAEMVRSFVDLGELDPGTYTITDTRGDHGVAITLRQGHAPGDAVCIQIAEIVRSFVDLGELDPGTYTISDTQNGAPPISVTVS
jgi:hypothetical protein